MSDNENTKSLQDVYDELNRLFAGMKQRKEMNNILNEYRDGLINPTIAKKMLEEKLLWIFAAMTEKTGEVFEDIDQAFSVIQKKLSRYAPDTCFNCGKGIDCTYEKSFIIAKKEEETSQQKLSAESYIGICLTNPTRHHGSLYEAFLKHLKSKIKGGK